MKEQERKELERMEKLAGEIERNPLTKKFREEEAAAILAKRTEAAGKIGALRKEQAEVILRLQAELAGKEAKYLKAKADQDAALAEFRTAKAELSGEAFQFDNVIRQQEAVLAETADPAIDAAIEFFRGKLDWLRSKGRISSRGMTVENNLIADTKTLTTETNKNAVLGALAYCQTAIKLLEALKLSPEFHIEGIQELKDGIPSIEVYVEVSGEKPFWPRDINPRDLLKSDSQMDWELGKLNQKFKKLMGRI